VLDELKGIFGIRLFDPFNLSFLKQRDDNLTIVIVIEIEIWMIKPEHKILLIFEKAIMDIHSLQMLQRFLLLDLLHAYCLCVTNISIFKRTFSFHKTFRYYLLLQIS
jgi:hypothetical protein